MTKNQHIDLKKLITWLLSIILLLGYVGSHASLSYTTHNERKKSRENTKGAVEWCKAHPKTTLGMILLGAVCTSIAFLKAGKKNQTTSYGLENSETKHKGVVKRGRKNHSTSKTISHQTSDDITKKQIDDQGHISLEGNNKVSLSALALAFRLISKTKVGITGNPKEAVELVQHLWEKGENYKQQLNKQATCTDYPGQETSILTCTCNEGKGDNEDGKGTSQFKLLAATGPVKHLKEMVENKYEELFSKKCTFFQNVGDDALIAYVQIAAKIKFKQPFQRYKNKFATLKFQNTTQVETFGFYSQDVINHSRYFKTWRKQIQVLVPQKNKESNFTENEKKFILKLANEEQKQCFIIGMGYEKEEEITALLKNSSYMFKDLAKNTACCKIPVVSTKDKELDLTTVFEDVTISKDQILNFNQDRKKVKETKQIDKVLVGFSLEVNESGGESNSYTSELFYSTGLPNSDPIYYVDQDFFLLHGSYDDNQDTPFSKHLGVFIGDTTYLVPLSA